MMKCCTSVCRKWTAFGFSVFFLLTGLVMVFCWENFFLSIMHKELSLANTETSQYKTWIETPIDIIFEVYFFNWTNSHDVDNGKKWTKPKFKQLGPYTYIERNSRANIVFNDNNTVSFNTIRKWKFAPDKTNGSLDDKITTFNPIALAVANVAKEKHSLIRRGVHYIFEESNVTLAKTATVKDFSFLGYNDSLIDIALALKIKGYEIPYDKFGWFYSRNDSLKYDGNLTMYTGADDIRKTGIVTEWNQRNFSKAYKGECARIDGSTGEVWNPIGDADSVSLFVSDTCSKVTLERDRSLTYKGVKGNRYISTDKLFDNGVKYPDMACFNPGVRLPAGVRNLSDCQYNAPAFLSLPHFNLADPSYADAVEGMNPDLNKHRTFFVLEPTFGFPLQIQAAFQVNMRMSHVDGIGLFENVKDTMLPMIWIRVTGDVPDDLLSSIKLILAVPTIGNCIGYVSVAIGVVLFIYGAYLEIMERRERQLD